MSADDVIPLPGHPGMYARRVVVEAWQAAGSPPVNSAGRLTTAQQDLYDGWAQRLPGFNPADNPAETWRPLAHVRFVGLDIDPTPARVAALTRAGLVRPYSYEPWHWQPAGDVRRWPLVTSLPATSSTTDKPFTPGGFLMALNDKQQDELYGWVKDIQNRVRGPKPDADMLQIIESATTDTAKRVRGEKPHVDMLQDILGQVGGTYDVDEAALAAEIAPYLVRNIGSLPDDVITEIAEASADVLAKRLAG